MDNNELNNFEALQISLASTEKILEWSRGVVKKPETINYRTLKPEKDGLFCEKIFGPTKDWECHCGKYKRIRYKGIVCDRCGVEVTKSKVRRERMGHIELAAPVSHIWYFKGIPSRIGLVLDISPKKLEKVLYFASYIALEKGNTSLEEKDLLTEDEYRYLKDGYVITDPGNTTLLPNDIISEDNYKELKNGFRANPAKKSAFNPVDRKKKSFILVDQGNTGLDPTSRQIASGSSKQMHSHICDIVDNGVLIEDEYYYLKDANVVKDPGNTGLAKGDIISEELYQGIINGYIVTSSESEETPVSTVEDFRIVSANENSNPKLKSKVVTNVLSQEDYKDLGKNSGVTAEKGKLKVEKVEFIANEADFVAEKVEFDAKMGAEAVRDLLARMELDKLSEELREALIEATGQKKIKIVRRLEVIEALRVSGNRPEWMILEVIPVIPPDIRPMVQLDGGRFATSDLNDLYRRVINRNNRLVRLLELNAPDIIVRNEKRMLQEAVDALIDNGRRGRPVTGPGSRPLKSLSDMLKGKQGRFRQNLLGKRVDYSGRSVIVVGPELKFYQCGLPKKMALELFKPFIMRELVENQSAHNIKSAKRMVDKVRPEVWDVLDKVIKEHPVLLNRAPTLHRLGIQAFEPVLVEGKAIKLHPLVCTAYNADFDGDQMAVHVPLTVEAQAEARYLMLSVNNILAPKDGSPITTPTQDMILGSYYLTHPGVIDKDPVEYKQPKKNAENVNPIVIVRDKKNPAKATTYWRGEPYEPEVIELNGENIIVDGKIFTDFDEMLMAYRNQQITIHSKVLVRLFEGGDDENGVLIDSTVGRFIFNEGLPQDLGIRERIFSDSDSAKEKKRKICQLEVDQLSDKKMLGKIIDKCFIKHGNTKTAIMLDYIKELGFHYSTIAAVTISISDMEIPEAKAGIVENADQVVSRFDEAYGQGLMSKEERYEGVVETWTKATSDVADALMDSLGTLNNLFIMANSGARGSKDQIRQIGGMRGLMANASGKTIEIPIRANFREGLSVLEYFISTNGARKGLADTALRTAESGYLTRRLVDVSHNIIVREEDCGTTDGIEISPFTEGKAVIERIGQRAMGRTALVDVIHPETGEVIVAANEEISKDAAERIENSGINKVRIRSVMHCKSEVGICAKCYGRNLATGETVNIGEAVGITAAQSIGEPGTQLTMRTFHTGGVAGGDITQGLPRVEELFESRKPKSLAEVCEEAGTVIAKDENKREITIASPGGDKERVYTAPFTSIIIVDVGQEVEAGDPLTSGPLYPKDILRYKGAIGVYDYILKEVQRVYKMQGVDINDKHIELIVSQMLSKYKIEDSGDTNLLPGGLYSKNEIDHANDALEEGEAPAIAKHELLGITKASLATNSFLSAASFQETTKVLTDAAIKGKKDDLSGLKENVIIGKLIPAGTGMKRYKNVSVDYGENTDYMNNYNNYVALDSDETDDEIKALGGMTDVEDAVIPGARIITSEEALEE